MRIYKKGKNPIHNTLSWGCNKSCDSLDVKILVKYLESKGRNCHINTGVHGNYPNAEGKFEFEWNKNGGDFLKEDVLKVSELKIKVSLHPITKVCGPLYHVGVDIIDAFCYSFYRQLTEQE